MKKAIAILLLVCMILSLAACAAKPEPAANESTEAAQESAAEATSTLEAAEEAAPAAEEPVTLTIWANANVIPAADLSKPENERFLNKAIAKFQEIHPNVEFEVVNYGDDTAQLQSDFKASILAEVGPDIVTIFSGTVVSDLSEGFVCLNDYLNDDLKENLVGWNTCAQDFDENKEIYGIPFGGQQVTGFAYNKSLIAQAGLDFEANPPETIDEFFDALDVIKNAGILPLHVDESYCRLILYCLGMWWEQKTGLAGILAHNTQGTLFAEDQGFLDMLTNYQKFYENGWVNSDTSTSADADGWFLQGKCAMFPMGDWKIPDYREVLGDDFGVIAVPSAVEGEPAGGIGGCGEALCVANYSENVDLAVEFVQFLASRENLIMFSQHNPGVPLRTDISAEEVGLADDPIYSKLVSVASSIYYWPDNCLSVDAGNVFYSDMPSQVLIGAMTPLELAQMMDEAQTD